MSQSFKPLRVAVLASGGGSNLSALVGAIKSQKLNARIALVISNNRDSGALEIARNEQIPALHLSQKIIPDQRELENSFLTAFREHNVELIALAGYMKKIDVSIIRAFKGKILNIHPALLPAFGGQGMYGQKVHKAVLDYGCKISGVTVHLVDENYDSGAPVLQRAVPVLEGDTPESLAARVLEEEHRIYAEAIQLFAEKRIEQKGRQIIIKDKKQ